MYFGGVPHGCVKAGVFETRSKQTMMRNDAARLTLARHYAIKLVKAELKAQGRRLQTVPMAEISVLARERMAEGMALADRSGLLTQAGIPR
jgi:hypothetical protein